MNREQYLLLKLAEEATEVAHIAMKCAQFGVNNVGGPKVEMNSDRLSAELNDLLAIVSMLGSESFFQFHKDTYAISDKVDRVEEWYSVSKSLGKVT